MVQLFWCKSDNCHPCNTADPTKDTVKVSPVVMAKAQDDKENTPAVISFEEQAAAERLEEQRRRQEEAQRRREDEARREQERERREQERLEEERREQERLEEERLQAKRQEEEWQAAREAMRQAEVRRQEEEELLRVAQVQREELARKAKADEERTAQEAADQEMVRTFLEANGFTEVSVNQSKRTSGLFSSGSTYPLHVAVKQGDDKMVGLLLAAGADAGQKDSSGKTPLALAEKLNKKNKKPSPVLEVLKASQ